jgi:hypothetical protein
VVAESPIDLNGNLEIQTSVLENKFKMDPVHEKLPTEPARSQKAPKKTLGAKAKPTDSPKRVVPSQ